MGGDDDARFADLVDDVVPLEQDRVAPERVAPRRRPVPAPASFVAAPLVEQPASHHAGGVQRGVLRQLRRGEIRPVARLDLHGYRRDGAQRLLEAFLAEAAAAGERCVLVIHGKGSRSAERVAVLRQMTRAVLVHHPLVMAYAPAVIRDGGEGALYALLRRPGS